MVRVPHSLKWNVSKQENVSFKRDLGNIMIWRNLTYFKKIHHFIRGHMLQSLCVVGWVPGFAQSMVQGRIPQDAPEYLHCLKGLALPMWLVALEYVPSPCELKVSKFCNPKSEPGVPLFLVTLLKSKPGSFFFWLAISSVELRHLSL